MTKLLKKERFAKKFQNHQAPKNLQFTVSSTNTARKVTKKGQTIDQTTQLERCFPTCLNKKHPKILQEPKPSALAPKCKLLRVTNVSVESLEIFTKRMFSKSR